MKNPILNILLLLICTVCFAQTPDRMGTGLINKWAMVGANYTGLTRAFDGVLQETYADTKKGPYFENKWFSATLHTLQDNWEVDDTVKFRFDLQYHDLHFSIPSDQEPKALALKYVTGFTLRGNGRERRFVKILPPMADIDNENVKYYELLSESKYRLLKVYYSELDVRQPFGPGHTGKVVQTFRKKSHLLLELEQGRLEFIKVKGKAIAELVPELSSNVKQFESNNGKIKTEDDLISFFNSI